jgi:hypothetical protein
LRSPVLKAAFSEGVNPWMVFIVFLFDESKVYTVYTTCKYFRIYFKRKYLLLSACFLIYIVYTFVSQ